MSIADLIDGIIGSICERLTGHRFRTEMTPDAAVPEVRAAAGQEAKLTVVLTTLAEAYHVEHPTVTACKKADFRRCAHPHCRTATLALAAESGAMSGKERTMPLIDNRLGHNFGKPKPESDMASCECVHALRDHAKRGQHPCLICDACLMFVWSGSYYGLAPNQGAMSEGVE